MIWTVQVHGDIEVDAHHTVEDTGIVLGQAFKEALGNKEGIARFGYFILPMDDALVLASLDISGRMYFDFEADLPAETPWNDGNRDCTGIFYGTCFRYWE